MLYFSHLLPDEETKEIIKETGMGLESIEFSISENLNHLDICLLAYEKRLERMGCKNLILHGPFLDLNPMTFDQRIREVTRQRYEEAYAAAKKLGAKKIVYHSCYVPDFYLLIGWAERMARFFEEFLADKDDTIEVVMENVLDRVWEPLKETAENVQHPAFGLCLDIGHAHCYGNEPVQQWVQGLFPDIRHVHVHDNQGTKDSHLALGEGNIKVQEVFQKLKQKALCTYTIECSSYEAVMKSYDRWKELTKNEKKCYSNLAKKEETRKII